MKNPNGYGSVYKLSGNRRKPWIARITAGWSDDKKQVYNVLGYFKTRREAQIALAEYHRDPYDFDLRELTFRDVFERWSSEHFPKISQSKINAYNSVFNQSAELHDILFHKIKTAHLQKLINDKSHLKSSTLAHHKSAYKQLYKYAIKHEFAVRNYADFIDLPKDSNSDDAHKIFSREEIDTLFAHYHAGVKNADIALVLLFTGFRIMELLELLKSNVNLAEGYITGGKKTRAGIGRIVPINKRILPIIEAKMQGESDVLFPTARGHVWRYQHFREREWIPLMKKLGMNHTAHDTRHTFISMLSEAGVEKLVIQRIVGHSSQDVTDHYTHLKLEQLREGINKI